MPTAVVDELGGVATERPQAKVELGVTETMQEASTSGIGEVVAEALACAAGWC